MLTSASTSPLVEVDHDRRSAHVLHRFLSGELQAHVERQHEVFAGHRPFGLDTGDARAAVRAGRRRVEQHASLRVHHLLAVANAPVQDALVRALDARLADVLRPSVLAALDALEILRADAADVADRVRACLSERIRARQHLLNVDAGEVMAAHREARSLLLVEAADLHALEAAMAAHECDELVVLGRIHELELLERDQRRL